jgi:hypothetical protein
MKTKNILLALFILSLILPASGSSQNSTANSAESELDYINILLCRPSDKSISISLLPAKNLSVYIDYRKSTENYTDKTETRSLSSGATSVYLLDNLTPNTMYCYRLRYRENITGEFIVGDEHTFRTQRSRGNSFCFTIEADPHLYDKKGCASLMKIAQQNQLNDKPDFMFDLGDTFGDDHNPFEITNEEILILHSNFRAFTGTICHSVPFLFCIGNHEGEFGYYLLQTPPNNIAVYASLARKYYFPNPVPDNFYSGNTASEENGIGAPENYYAFEWGDALFIILDAYRYFESNAKPREWEWTLGKTQYDWMENTLMKSSAKFKFIFIHHLFGQTRGGAEIANGFEWGGYNKDSRTLGFATNRPGWNLPIHQLMLKYGVNILFQGHDHLYAKEDLDGIVYQEVPMPSDSTYIIGITDNGDAYSGVKLDASGHLRVTVSSSKVTVDYVRAWLPADETDGHKNGEIAYSYEVSTKTTSAPSIASLPSKYELKQNYPNPFNPSTKIYFSLPEPGHVSLKIYNCFGQLIQTLAENILQSGNHSYEWNARNLPSGIYFYQIITPKYSYTKKALLLK